MFVLKKYDSDWRKTQRLIKGGAHVGRPFGSQIEPKNIYKLEIESGLTQNIFRGYYWQKQSVKVIKKN